MHLLKNNVQLRSAFSLLEVLLAVALMSVIVFAMVSMFDLVQKSFRAGSQQTGVFDAGKAVMDIISTDLGQTDVCEQGDIHTMVRLNPTHEALTQPFPGGGGRTNIMMDHFSMRSFTNNWIASGFRLLPSTDTDNPYLATLYRFQVVTNDSLEASIASEFLLKTTDRTFFTNLVAEGVVHLSLYPMDARGFLITDTNVYNSTDVEWGFRKYNPEATTNVLPAFLELEVGILEPKLIDRMRQFTSKDLAEAFLKKNTASVHLFRRRIPISTAPREL